MKTHVGRILGKLGARDRVQAVIIAHRHGYVPPPDRAGTADPLRSPEGPLSRIEAMLYFADSAADAPPATPGFWTDALVWLADGGFNLLKIAGIILGAIVVARLLRIVIRRVVKRIVQGAKTKANVDDTQALERSLASVRLVQRTRTLGSILQNVVNVAIVIVALTLIVLVLNKDALGSLTLLSAAVGAGLGFGAQNIVKDVLNGIFLVAEDQVGIGDRGGPRPCDRSCRIRRDPRHARA